jgi:RNA polymerase-binding protein DksA
MKALVLKLKEDSLKEINKKLKTSSDLPAGEPSGDIYDQASSERDRELGLLLNDREREKLRNIDEALLRIEEGEYGICEECGCEIPIGRLRVMPFAIAASSARRIWKRCRRRQNASRKTGYTTSYPSVKRKRLREKPP